MNKYSTHQQTLNGHADNLVADLRDGEQSPTLLPENLYTAAWSYYYDREVWFSIPVYAEPKAVSGEIPWR